MSSILKVDTIQDASGNAIISSDGSGNLSIPNLTTTGDINFGDNDKAQFGASQDLQIYHDTINSYIVDNGTGNLFIRGSNLILEDSSGNDFIAMADTGTGGTVSLKHNAVTKLATTSTGIDVTGTVVSDGLTVDTDTLHVDAVNNRVGIGTTIPNVSGLEISKATGSSSPTPVELRLTTTTSASDWTTTDPYARISFYSKDGSTSGPKIMNTIEAITTGLTGGISNLVFKGRTNKLLELNEDISYFYTGNTERMRIDSSGTLMVGKTSSDVDTSGFEVASNGNGSFCRSGNLALYLVRNTTDGEIVQFRKDGAPVGRINVNSSRLAIGQGSVGLWFDNLSQTAVRPFNVSTNSDNDNVVDLGSSGSRFDDVYATNGTIQTSDQNEKQSIQSLTATEIAVAKRISKLFKTFKFNSSVEEKGDSARTHTGIIAQDVQQAFADEGLDAGNYALFISSTWWEKEISVDAVAPQEAVYETQTDEEGNEIQVLVQEAVEGKDAYTYIDTKEEATEGYTEKTRLGIRYPELLSFVSSAFEQRLTDIETRLTALEA